MITVLREAGMRFVIFTDDHEPSHVHVYADGEARIDIRRVIPISNRGMSRRDLARAMAIVEREQVSLLLKWKDIHG